MVYQISSGHGPMECELAVYKFYQWISSNYNVTPLVEMSGPKDECIQSITFSSEEDLSSMVGTIKWICKSPFRPNHKRKNWFIDFSFRYSDEEEGFDPENIVFSTCRSSGAGGQNVNKVESAVRATYVPTGDTVFCEEERSQLMNKKKAIARLKDIIDKRNEENKKKGKEEDWRRHSLIVRGNAELVFEGMDFKRVK